MYGYTPPAVIAIDPDILSSCGDFQRVAALLAQELRMRPVWAVVAAPESLVDAYPSQRPWILEGWCRDPAQAPEAIGDDLHTATAQVLAAHLMDEGFQLPMTQAPFAPQPHVPGSRIVPGTWRTAAEAARALQAPHVRAWTQDPEFVHRSIQGVPFFHDLPGLSRDALGGPTWSF